MKFLVFLTGRGDASVFRTWVAERFAPDLAARVEACVLNQVLDGSPSDTWTALVEAWGDGADVLACCDTAELRGRAARIAAYACTEVVEKDDGVVRGEPTPGVKLIAPWIGRDDVARTQIRRHWDEHVPLANRIHIGVRRYVRNWIEGVALAPTPFPPPYQGVAFQYFDSPKDLAERSFDRPESVQIITDDVADFITRHEVLLATEHVIKAGNIEERAS